MVAYPRGRDWDAGAFVSAVVKKSVSASFERKLKAIQARIAKNRDELRTLIGDAKELRYDCDEALEDIQTALDALSRLQ